MTTQTYRNKRNTDKYLIVRKYDDGHTVWKQYLFWLITGVHNYTGCSLRSASRGGRFSRVRKATATEVLADYTLICNH